MNCYYSNLIEGHYTHPIDIERALKNDYSREPKKRNLQREARAHIIVQKWIDCIGLRARALSIDGICEIHRRFCEQLPPDLLWVEDSDTKERVEVVAGELRKREVKVGDHVPISPGDDSTLSLTVRGRLRTPRQDRRDSCCRSRTSSASWIHPFIDGNGVARLMSHARLLDTLDTGAVWSFHAAWHAGSIITEIIWPLLIWFVATISTVAVN